MNCRRFSQNPRTQGKSHHQKRPPVLFYAHVAFDKIMKVTFCFFRFESTEYFLLFFFRKLLDALPDNGRKVRHFVQTLRQLILQRQSPGTSVFKNCDSSISATGISPDQHSSRTGSLSEFATLHDSSSLDDNEPAATSSDSSVQSTGKCDDLLEQGTHAKEDDEEDGAAATLTDCLEGLVISELPVPNSTSGAEMVCHVPSGGRNLETVFPNSYAKVMQRSSESGNKRAPFKPNRWVLVC